MARRIGKLECCRVNANRVGQGAAKTGVLIAVPPSDCYSQWIQYFLSIVQGAVVDSRPAMSKIQKSYSFVAEGGHGIEAAGAEGRDVPGGTGDDGERSGGQAQREWIMRSEAEELTLDDASQC